MDEMPGGSSLKILVIDDHALVREGLHQVLQGLGGTVEVLEAATCARAFELAAAHHDLDLVLLDYHLPDMNGLQALDVFSRQHPELPIIVLSGSVNPRIMQQVMDKGAAAFLTKSGKSAELLTATRLVLDGGIYVSSAAAPQIPAMPAAPLLTPRQEDVLRLLLDGYSNKEIGRRLNLSDETVKNHVTAILRGFGVQSRTQAVLAANRYGYGQPTPPAEA